MFEQDYLKIINIYLQRTKQKDLPFEIYIQNLFDYFKNRSNLKNDSGLLRLTKMNHINQNRNKSFKYNYYGIIRQN